MKPNKITSAAIVLAVAAVLGTSAHAQAVYTPGDLLLGFDQQNNAATDDYVVDLGAVTQFTNPSSSTETFQISLTDLNNTFGTNWASNSQTNLVQWGAIGGTTKGNPAAPSLLLNGTTFVGNTDFYTVGELTPGTQSPPPLEKSNGTQNGWSGKIANFDTGTGGFAGTTLTGNGSYQAINQTHNAGNSFSYEISSQTDFGIGGNLILQPTAGTGTGPTDSVLDLYESVPVNGQAATYLGNFNLGNNGLLTFNAANTAAVPEPSTYSLIGLGAMFLILHLRRKAASVL